MFLTPAEIRDLTGSAQRSRQIAWLKEHAWRFTTNLRGLPVVARAEAERQLVSDAPTGAPSRLHWKKVA